MARVDYDAQSGRYDRGRTLPDQAIDVWMAAISRHVPAPGTVLDLGSGTGRFSAALADALDADVVAIEPSAGMRERARTKPHARVRVVGGTAGALPLRDDVVDVAWLSNVIHHFDDLPTAAAELRRVVSGTILIRGAFAGRPVPSLYRFFPSTEQVIDTFPSIPQTIAAFQDAGFGSFLSEQVPQLLASSLAEMVPRIAERADTTLEAITDEDFERGLAQLRVAAERETGPVVDPLDLLVIR